MLIYGVIVVWPQCQFGTTKTIVEPTSLCVRKFIAFGCKAFSITQRPLASNPTAAASRMASWLRSAIKFKDLYSAQFIVLLNSLAVGDAPTIHGSSRLRTSSLQWTFGSAYKQTLYHGHLAVLKRFYFKRHSSMLGRFQGANMYRIHLWYYMMCISNTHRNNSISCLLSASIVAVSRYTIFCWSHGGSPLVAEKRSLVDHWQKGHFNRK